MPNQDEKTEDYVLIFVGNFRKKASYVSGKSQLCLEEKPTSFFKKPTSFFLNQKRLFVNYIYIINSEKWKAKKGAILF